MLSLSIALTNPSNVFVYLNNVVIENVPVNVRFTFIFYLLAYNLEF